MIPDKIVIMDGEIYRTEKTCINDIEYIRKDALLEWAKENNKKIDAEEGDYSLGYISAMIDLIEKIESL